MSGCVVLTDISGVVKTVKDLVHSDGSKTVSAKNISRVRDKLKNGWTKGIHFRALVRLGVCWSELPVEGDKEEME